MHELPVTESLLKLAEQYAVAAEAAKVTDLYLIIGQLSSIVDDSMQFYWDIVSKGTLCEGAKLHFERVPASLLCLDCAHIYAIEGELTACPQCGSSRVKVTVGEEFRLDSIEIEEEMKER